MSGEILHADLKNPYYVEWMKFLENSEDWDLKQIQDYQMQQISKVLTYAFNNSVGYRELFQKFDIEPRKIQSFDDFQKIPFIEKHDIRDRLEDFSTPLEGRFFSSTGGSTGIPTGMYRDQSAFGKELASKAHQYHRLGWKEGTKQMVFRGLKIDNPSHVVYEEKFNELRCSTYHFDPAFMEKYRQLAYEYQPEWIRCYPSSGYVFARYLKDNNKKFPPLKGILCSSENLYDFQKDLLKEIFNVRPFSHYGHYEMAALAGFCEYEDTYHVLPQYGYAELIDNNGKLVTTPGSIGEIVATSFITYATPFIRYKTQDIAVLKGWGCSSCGRPYQIWGRIEGRLQELMVTKSGRTVSTSMVNMHDDFYTHIYQFQFVQKEKGKVFFNYIPKSTCNDVIVKSMYERMVQKFDNDIEIQMEEVKEIPLTSRGKHRLLVQEMKLEYDDLSLSEALHL